MKTAVISFIIFSMLGAVQMTGCSHDDTALVTINMSGRVLESRVIQKTVLDKIFGFFVSDVCAGASSHVWERDAMKLIITGDGMGDINADIPPSQLTYSIEVPAGENRLITVIATKSNVKNSGGSITVNLTAGEEKQISLKMKPIIQNFNASNGSTISMFWNAILDVSGYKIYRSVSANGVYELIKTINDYTIDFSSDTPSPAGTYYYKIKIYDADGDGEFSDYTSAFGG